MLPRKRNDKVFHDDLPYYHCVELNKDTFDTDAEVEVALWEFAKTNWGGINNANGLRWKKGNAIPVNNVFAHGARDQIRCHYWNRCGCRWRAEVLKLRDNQQGILTMCIHVGTIEHLNDHRDTLQKRGSLSQALAVVLTSQDSLSKQPAVLVARARRKGITVNTAQSKALKRAITRKRHLAVGGVWSRGPTRYHNLWTATTSMNTPCIF